MNIIILYEKGKIIKNTRGYLKFLINMQAYGFNKKSYFTNRKQRTKTGDGFSKYQRIITGLLQGSILGPLIFINDLFIIIIDKPT